MTRVSRGWLPAIALVLHTTVSVRSESLRFDFGLSPLARMEAQIVQRRKQHKVPRCRATPRIDSVADDAAWESVTGLTDFGIATPDNARRCGEGLMKNIRTWLSGTACEVRT